MPISFIEVKFLAKLKIKTNYLSKTPERLNLKPPNHEQFSLPLKQHIPIPIRDQVRTKRIYNYKPLEP